MDFAKEREEMIERCLKEGYIRTEWMAEVMRKVPRELFVPVEYLKDTYHDDALPIPPFTDEQTISGPYTYPVFYESLQLRRGDRFLEIGTGSGYGAALAREIVGEEGKVVTIEINEETYKFGESNLRKAGYNDVVVIHGNGSEGYAKGAPYDKICITAGCSTVPQALMDQLNTPGKLIAPVEAPPSIRALDFDQILELSEKDENGTINRKSIRPCNYVPLRNSCS